MEYAVAIKLNGETVVLTIHPTLVAATAAAKASLFADAFVVSKR